MAEVLKINELPIDFLQNFIIILKTNINFTGKGKIKNYFLIKDENSATIIYDNGTFNITVNLYKNKLGEWFFDENFSIQYSASQYSTSQYSASQQNNALEKKL